MKVTEARLRRILLTVVLLLSAAIQWLLRPAEFTGPDTLKFLEIASKQLEPGFWSDPSAFDGNYWSVGYPTFLALTHQTVGDSRDVMQIVHILLGLMCIILVWLITAKLGSAVQVASTVVLAFNPNFWALSAMGGYEVLLGVLILTSTFLTWKFCVRPTDQYPNGKSAFLLLPITLSGLLLGVAVIVQSKAFILLIPFALYWWKNSIRSLMVGFLGVFLALLPWSARNFIVLGSVNPFNTNGPVNMWIGNNPGQTTGGFMNPPPLPENTSSQVDAAIQFTLSQPEFAFQLMIRKMGRLMEPLFFYATDGGASVLQFAVHSAAIVMSTFVVSGFITYFVGRIWLSSPPMPPVGFLASIVVAFYVVNLPFIAESRFMSPVLPLTTVVATSAFVNLFMTLKSRKVSHALRPAI